MAVVLAVLCLFYGGKLLIWEDDLLALRTCPVENELAASLLPYALVFIGQKLNSLDFLVPESELPLRQSSRITVADASFIGEFPDEGL